MRRPIAYERLKSRSQCLSHPRPGVFVRFSQRDADGPQPGHMSKQVRFGHLPMNVDRIQDNIGPPAARQDAPHLVAVGERELPRRIRIRWRHVWQQRFGRAPRRRHERILCGASPGHEGKLPLRSQGALDVGECRDGILGKHHTEARNRRIETSSVKCMGLRIGLHEARIADAVSGGLRPGGREQGFGNIDAGAAARS